VELRFFPREMISPVVLVYLKGTVFGYVGLDGAGRVALVRVAIS
jgi:ABC-type methionine transport system ATPase subunit